MDVTKIETNNLVLNKQLFNLIDIIQDIIQDYDDQIDNENIKLNCNFLYSNAQTCSIKKEEIVLKDNNNNINEIKGKYSIFLFADKTRISQVLSNLLSNAIKFTNKGFINIIIEKNDDDDDDEKSINQS